MKTCLLICAPKLSETADFVRPLSRTDFFHEALNAPHLGIELLHPAAVGAASFPVWLDKVAGGTQASVPDKRLQNVFQSPSRNQGLLFLKSPARSDIRLTFEGARYHYAGLEAAELNHPDSLLFRPLGGNLRRRLLRETRRVGDELTHWQIGVERSRRPPEAWMNPLILRIELSGSSCAPPPPDALASDTRVAFAELMRHTDVLALVPGFEPEDDVRCRAWRLLLQRVSERPSAVERLVLGATPPDQVSADDVAWTFTALDSLGGRFVVDDHGQAERRTPVKYTWHPNPRSAPNTLWLGHQLVTRWSQAKALIPTGDEGSLGRGPSGEQSPRNPISRESNLVFGAAPPGRNEQAGRVVGQQDVLTFPQRPFAIAPQRFTAETIQNAVKSLPSYLRLCTEWQPDVAAETTLKFFLELLDDLTACQVPFEQRLHRRWFRLVGKDRLATDVPGLLNDLAKELVVPRSPLWVKLPKPSARSATTYVDLVKAVPGGARALVWALLKDRSSSQSERNLALTMGWWNTWHTTLFEDPADVRIRFRESQFELGSAVLGKGALGGAPDTNLDATTAIRFSIPM